MFAFLVIGCGGSPAADPPAGSIAELTRISVALRGIRPSRTELDAVQVSPAALDPIVDGWLDTDAFGDTLRDLHAEVWRFRADSLVPLPSLGPLESTSSGAITASVNEAPLRWVEALIRDRRPYTEVLTAGDTFVDPVVAAVFQGAAHDSGGDAWQQTSFTDGRPAAGLLSQPMFHHRYRSDAFNFHRQRATAIARIFLCTDYEVLDSSIDGAVFVSEPPPADELTRPECAACHAELEPIAAALWGFEPHTSQILVNLSYDKDCEGTNDEFGTDVVDTCYPLRYWNADRSDDWADWGLHPPGLRDQPVDDLAALGRTIAADPRFAECTTRRFYGYFTETDPLAVSGEVIDPLVDTFVGSGFDAVTLIRAIVTSDAFRTGPPRIVRPEQLGRTIEDLTGFRWQLDPDPDACRDGTQFEDCWGTVDLLGSSRFGFRVLGGGIDGTSTVTPEHTPTPTRAMVGRALASRAAAFVVAADLAEPDPGRRRLLRRVESGDDGEEVVRDQLADVAFRVLAHPVAPDGPEVDALYALFVAGRAGASPADGWVLALTGLLDDPELWFW
ncbi:MAG: DUF1585 domain-containing protein [Myxococcota bacterium]